MDDEGVTTRRLLQQAGHIHQLVQHDVQASRALIMDARSLLQQSRALRDLDQGLLIEARRQLAASRLLLEAVGRLPEPPAE